MIETWRRHYNTKRPHSSLGYRPPAPEIVLEPAPPAGRSAGRTNDGARRAAKLTFQLDHSVGADHWPPMVADNSKFE